MALSAHQTDNDGEKAIKTALRGLIMEKKNHVHLALCI